MVQWHVWYRSAPMDEDLREAAIRSSGPMGLRTVCLHVCLSDKEDE